MVADLHGRFNVSVAILKGNGVVDDNLNWIYGKNQLVFVGNIFDRGRDDNGIAWLVYKLEKVDEAGTPYAEFYSVGTELDRWLLDSYLIVTVVSDLFVYGGLSPEMVNRSYIIGGIK